jgi:hypothetical protein
MATINKVGGGIFSDMITWVRRIIKTSSVQSISDAVIADYINRFAAYEAAERVQLLEFKRTYTFETIPNVHQYQAPFFSSTTPSFPGSGTFPPFLQNPSPAIARTVMPMYQNFNPPIYCDGIPVQWYQSNDQFYNVYPEYVNNTTPVQGDNTVGPYTIDSSQSPILQAFIDDLGNLCPYVYVAAQNDDGSMQYIVDTPYRTPAGLGILVQTDSTFQNITGPALIGSPPTSGGSGTVDYSTGQMTFTFSTAISSGANIQILTSPYSGGFPRACLFFNNTFKLYPVPQRVHKIQVDANITPSVFFNTLDSVPFAYMAQYLARGAAQMILSDNADIDQFNFYEPKFREQENLVLRRTLRQKATVRTPTIYSSPGRQQASWWGGNSSY